MINIRRAILFIPSTFLLLAACSTAASPPPTGPAPTGPAASGPATTTGAATTAPGSTTTAATDSPTSLPTTSAATPASTQPPAATPAASLSSDLSSLIPTEIAGNKMFIEPASNPARSFMILWGSDNTQVAQDILDDLGASEDDIDVVFSYLDDPASVAPNQIHVDAYRVAGADGLALRDGMVANYRAFYEDAGVEVSVTEETVGGKTTSFLTLPAAPPGQGQYYYNVGDIVFVVDGQPKEWIEEAFAKLP